MKNTKLLTNRNGGPKTEAGRKRSSANALRHGVLSNKMIVLQTESEEEFEMLKRGYYEALKPANFLEAELVDEMIWAKWRQRRAITSETAAIDFQMDMEADRVDRKVENIDESTRTAHAIRTLSNESGELALYSRYETRLNRMYHRALERLLEMQDRRRAEAQAAEHGEGQVAENTAPAPGSRPENKKVTKRTSFDARGRRKVASRHCRQPLRGGRGAEISARRHGKTPPLTCTARP